MINLDIEEKLVNETISALDLEPIMVKLMDKEEGLGWPLDFTTQVAEEYRRFLSLCRDFPDFPMVPSCYVDDFWHHHILDTMKYAEDCESIFGYFLHHFPYFGMRGEEDEKNLSRAWEESCALYRRQFGPLNPGLWPKSKRCPNCGRRCKGVHPFMSDAPRPRLAA